MTLHGTGGRIPNRSTTKASTRIRTAWTKRERKRLMPESLQGQEEGHEIDVLLRGQRLAEHRRHHTLRVTRDGAHRGRVENLAHDVLGGLDLGDMRQVGADLRGADLARLVTGDTGALAGEYRLARLRVAGQLELRHAPVGRGAGGLGNVVELRVHGPAERLQECGDRPELGAVEPDRRLVDARHDIRVSLDHV